MTSAYFVEENHTLLYKQDGQSVYGILASKPQLGARFMWEGDCHPDPAKIRRATKADFDFFRVCSKGYFPA